MADTSLDDGSLDDGDAALDEFVQQLTMAQTSLRAYIMASLGNTDDVPDVLQRTNLSLWKNVSKFRHGSLFMPWAITIAKYEILSYCRDKGRDRHVYPEDLAELMSDKASEIMLDLPSRQAALRLCLNKLSQKQNSMLRMRYYEEKTIMQIATVLHGTENSVKSALLRVRKALHKCIDARIRAASI